MIMKRTKDNYYLTYLLSPTASYGNLVEISPELSQDYDKVWDAMYKLQDKLDKLKVIVATK